MGMLVLALLVLPHNANAASTIVLSQTSQVVNTGQIFTVNVVANPTGSTGFTVKAIVRYPANLLEVRSFTFRSGWLLLTQPDYDFIDNVGGVMVKSAGLPGGFTGAKVLGTITFRAKAAGTGTVNIDGSSLVLDSGSQNTFTGGNQMAITVRQGTTAVLQTSTSVSPSASPSGTSSVSPVPSSADTASDSNNGLASIFGSASSGKIILGIAIALLLILLLLWLLSRSRSDKDQGPPDQGGTT